MQKLKNLNQSLLLFWVGMIIVFIIFVYIRYPVLNYEDSFRYFSSDHAIFVMMAEDIKSLTHFPFFYWGGTYLGPLANIFMTITQLVMQLIGISQPIPTYPEQQYIVGPLASTINTLWMTFGGIVFFGLGLRKFFTVWESLLTCLILSVGSSLMVLTSIRPLGPEVALFLGGILFWRGILLTENHSHKDQMIFGYLAGLSWWMNQMVVFVLVPIIFYFFSQTNLYRELRLNLHFKDRYLLNFEALGLPPIPKKLKYFLHFLYSIFTLNFLLGVFIAITGELNGVYGGVKIKILNGVSTMKSSLLIFALSQFLIWFFLDKESKQKIKAFLFPIRFLILGFALGYGPVILGKIFHWYPPGYAPTFKFIPAQSILPYWKRLYDDYFINLFIGEASKLYIPFFIILFAVLSFHLYQNRKEVYSYLTLYPQSYSKLSLLWPILLFNLVYIVISDRARDQYAPRYSILMLPVLAIYCASIWRVFSSRYKLFGIILSVLLSCIMGYGLFIQGKSFVAEVKATPSIVQQMKILANSECEIYYTDYWNSYNFEYFMQKKKRFVVLRGQERTPELKIQLENSNLKKCDLSEVSFEIKHLNF